MALGRGAAGGGRAGRAAVALVLAYALFAQVLLASAAAAMAAGPGGAFLLVLCRPSGNAGGSPQTPAHGYPGCCVLGCPLAAPLAPPPDLALAAPLRFPVAWVPPVPPEEIARPIPRRLAHRARAPPGPSRAS